MLVRNVHKISIDDAFRNEKKRYTFEVNHLFIAKYHKGIKFYVDRLRNGATAGVRGKTDVQFWNPASDRYEYINDGNENLLDYRTAKVGELEGGEISIATVVFLPRHTRTF